MIVIDYDTALSVVKQIYPSANDPMLNIELEATKKETTLTFYRPYIVAAKFIITEYRRLSKADEVTFQYDLDKTVSGLLNRQKEIDIINGVEDTSDIEAMLDEVCDICSGVNDIGVYIV